MGLNIRKWDEKIRGSTQIHLIKLTQTVLIWSNNAQCNDSSLLLNSEKEESTGHSKIILA